MFKDFYLPCAFFELNKVRFTLKIMKSKSNDMILSNSYNLVSLTRKFDWCIERSPPTILSLGSIKDDYRVSVRIRLKDLFEGVDCLFKKNVIILI